MNTNKQTRSEFYANLDLASMVVTEDKTVKMGKNFTKRGNVARVQKMAKEKARFSFFGFKF